jgi:dolichyl-phosphate-mannose--protein O-mannosyl transferase
MTEILLHLSYLAAIGFCCCTLGWLWLQADKNPVTRALAVCQILIIICVCLSCFWYFPGAGK